MTPPPTSVLLPTVTWTDACDQVADQLAEDDELLVVHDGPDDPVTRRAGDLPDGVRLVAAGDPQGCSGKANAVAAGMEAAGNDRLVWTDDDFDHPDDWLATLQADYERHGPVTELPVFVGRDPLALLLEPIYVSGSASVYAAGKAWAGAVVFDREDVDEAAFLADLRRTVSDDGLLSEYLDVTPLRRTREVPVGGSFRTTLERQARFAQILRHHGPVGTAVMNAVTLLVALACLVYPLYLVPAVTALHAGTYAALGVRRWTALLAVPATLAWVPLFAYGVARRTFVWGGRRYRWRSKFDVEVVE
jgi:hypothetical protein